MAIPDVVAELCKEHNITVNKLEKSLNLGQGLIAKWAKSAPRTDKLKMVADYFDVSVDYLLTGEKVVENSNIRKNIGNKSDSTVDELAKFLAGKMEEEGYYVYQATANEAQELLEDEDMRLLFDAAKDSKPEDLRMAADLLKRLKQTNEDG